MFTLVKYLLWIVLVLASVFPVQARTTTNEYVVTVPTNRMELAYSYGMGGMKVTKITLNLADGTSLTATSSGNTYWTVGKGHYAAFWVGTSTGKCSHYNGGDKTQPKLVSCTFYWQ